MKTKSAVQVQNQIYRIDKMLMDNRTPNNLKRFKKWVEVALIIQHQMLAYFSVNHLGEISANDRLHEPLPYAVRVTH